MKSAQLADFMKRYILRLEDALLRWLPLSDKPGTELFNQAVHYAAFPGGKRMRPLFTLLAARTVGGDPEKALPVACAIEYFHTCSLIFDDLPAMDDAHERRGRRSTHMAFGQDVAILAGLAFFNQGYALIGRMDCPDKEKDQIRRLIEEMAACIGPDGMIGGQFLDLRLRPSDDEQFRSVSYLKTTGLMRLMLTAGAIAAGANKAQITALATFGQDLGEAYQMLDDLVDESEDYFSRPKYNRGGNIHALWNKADEKLKQAHSGLIEGLTDSSPSLLLELTEMIFGKLKDQVSRGLTDQPHGRPLAIEPYGEVPWFSEVP